MELTYRGVVYPAHCDHMGHMNVASYVAKFDEATWHVFRLCGITRSYMEDQGRAMAGVHQDIHYRRELFPGDTVRIESRVLETGARKLRWLHEMFDDVRNELVASCELTAVHIDSRSRKATEFGSDIRAAAERLIDPSGTTDIGQ